MKIKVYLTGISPMVWRRVLVPATISLRELHGVFQVAMGWDGIHLFQFRLRAISYGSEELWATSPDITLADLRLRDRARFAYEYDLNIPWLHEVRIEERITLPPGKELPNCIDGSGACPPEECGGPEGFMAGLDEAALSPSALEDLDTMVEVLRAVALEGRREMLHDDETRGRPLALSTGPQAAIERTNRILLLPRPRCFGSGLRSGRRPSTSPSPSQAPI